MANLSSLLGVKDVDNQTPVSNTSSNTISSTPFAKGAQQPEPLKNGKVQAAPLGSYIPKQKTAAPTKPIPDDEISPEELDELEIPDEKEPEKPKQKPKKEVPKLRFIDEFGRNMRKCELWLGNPGTGKTTLARGISEKFIENDEIDDYAVIECHGELTKMGLFKTTKTDENGQWAFIFNKVFNMITDEKQRRYIVIFDEFNTLTMDVMKAVQPILDDTTGRIDFEEKQYYKNPNVSFILTINHRDLGVTPLPDAIKDRSFKVFFDDIDIKQLAKWTNVPESFIELLERIHAMFKGYGELPEFHKSARRLKDLNGLTRKQFRDYIIAELELAGIEWREIVNISPEFNNLLDEFDMIGW